MVVRQRVLHLTPRAGGFGGHFVELPAFVVERRPRFGEKSGARAVALVPDASPSVSRACARKPGSAFIRFVAALTRSPSGAKSRIMRAMTENTPSPVHSAGLPRG